MSDGTATPKSKLDSLSREDLVKFVKKQVANLKFYKDQCAEQNEKIIRLEEKNQFLSSANEQLQKPSISVTEVQCQIEDENDVNERRKNKEFSNELQLRQQIMVLRTALNRRRFEIEDLREKLNQRPVSHLAISDYPAAAAMEKIKNSSLIVRMEVSVQTDNDVDEFDDLKLKNEILTRKLQDLTEKTAKPAEPADGSILALKIEEYQCTIQKLQNDFALKSAELSSKITENQLLSEELSGLRQSLGELKLSSEDSRAKFKKLEEGVENANFHLKEKEEEASAAWQKCQNIEQQLNEAKSVCSQHQQRSVQLAETVSNLKQLLANNQDECDKAKSALQEITDAYETFKICARKNIETADESMLTLEIQKLQSDFALKSAELSLKITENQSLSVELNDLQQSFAELKLNSDDSFTKLKKMEKEVESANFRVKEKDEEASAALQKCRNFELQLNEAKLELSSVHSKNQQNSLQLAESVANLKQLLYNSQDECEKAKSALRELAAEYETFKKNAETADNSMLTLEIEDYQRTVQKLQSDFTVKSAELSSKIMENQSLSVELNDLQQSYTELKLNSEDSHTKLKKLEKDIENANFFAKEKDDEASAALEKCRNFEMQLNEAKLELSGVYSLHQQSSLQSTETVANLKHLLSNSQDECEKVKSALREITTEYETFKVRAHSVFKQKRGEPEEDIVSRNEKTILEKSIASLQEQLVKANGLYQSTLDDLHRSQEQYDQSITKHKDRESRFEQTVDLLRKQVNELRYESVVQKQNHDEFIQRATLNQTQLKADFEKQVQLLSEQNAEKISEMRMHVYNLEETLREARSTRSKDTTHMIYSETEERPPPIDERKPAEGSEHVDLKLAPLAADLNRLNSPLSSDFPQLDDILNFDHQSETGTISFVDYSAIENKMEDALKRNRHLAEVLAESEANNTRLNEQIRLLKDEIRRLERNQEREKHIANAEYLKNVIMKFVNPKAKEQRSSLVPVMATLLRLSAEEIKILEGLCNEGGGQNPTSPGWSGYLNRWSGLT